MHATLLSHGHEDMTTLLYSNILQRMIDISGRIVSLLGELRPVTDQIDAGFRDPDILEKNNRLQAEIARLDELRDELRNELRKALSG